MCQDEKVKDFNSNAVGYYVTIKENLRYRKIRDSWYLVTPKLKVIRLSERNAHIWEYILQNKTGRIDEIISFFIDQWPLEPHECQKRFLLFLRRMILAEILLIERKMESSLL